MAIAIVAMAASVAIGVVTGCRFDPSGLAGEPATGADAASPAADASGHAADAAADATEGTAVGLVPSGDPSTAGTLGGDGGSPFVADCPGQGVITGLEAGDNDFGLCQLRAICKQVELDQDGHVQLVGLAHTEPHGSETSHRELDPVECPPQTLMVGFSGSAGAGQLVRHLRLRCAPLTWDGTDYAIGSSFELPVNLGRPAAAGSGAAQCPAGMVAAGFQGRAGTIVDRFELRCFRLAPVYP